MRISDKHCTQKYAVPKFLFHRSLRNSYVARKYEAAMEAGASDAVAKLEASHRLGHGRPQVTSIYLHK